VETGTGFGPYSRVTELSRKRITLVLATASHCWTSSRYSCVYCSTFVYAQLQGAVHYLTFWDWRAGNLACVRCPISPSNHATARSTQASRPRRIVELPEPMDVATARPRV
jgi:hypothetical protein